VNWSTGPTALVPPAVVTVTSTVPVPGGEITVQEVSSQDAPAATVPPKATVPPARPDPVTVTAVPPVAGPPAGAIAVTTGAGTGAAQDRNRDQLGSDGTGADEDVAGGVVIDGTQVQPSWAASGTEIIATSSTPISEWMPASWTGSEDSTVYWLASAIRS